jgi:hypothetical protein
MKFYYIKISKILDKPHNKLSTENNGKSPRKIRVDFDSNNLIYDDIDGYGYTGYDGYDGYTSQVNKLVLFGKNELGEDIQDEVYINKNGSYIFENKLFSSVEKIEGYLNIKDIYEEPCVLSIKEVSPMTKRDSDHGKVAYIYGESNGTFIVSSGE